VNGKYLAGQSNDFVVLVLFQDVEDSLANVTSGSSDCNSDHDGNVRRDMEIVRGGGEIDNVCN
jgi:hypothetical protein